MRKTVQLQAPSFEGKNKRILPPTRLELVTSALRNVIPLLGIISVFQENRGRKHVKFVFAWKTVRLFPTQTKRKHNTIIPSVFTQK
jgi:hypothetical protein